MAAPSPKFGRINFREEAVEEDFKNNIDDDIWAESWLNRHYGGAPNECTWHFINVGIVKLNADGTCPKQKEHKY